MKILLLGAPNCGKSTLFNRLTGMSAHVGNFSGVTVDILEGEFTHGGQSAKIYDLPGTYSLDANSPDEQAAVSALKKLAPDRIIFICDATCLSRSMYLLTEILSYDIPKLIALNMSDELNFRGGSIDAEKLSSVTGIPAYRISAKTGEGIEELTEGIFSDNKYKPSELLLKVRDQDIHKRYDIIDTVLDKSGYVPPGDIKKAFIPDKALLDKYLSVPLFFVLVTTAFFIAFGPIGQGMVTFLTLFSEFLALKAASLPGLWGDYISNCLIKAVGGVLSFIPPVMLLSLFMSLLEDSGYMARAAVITDKPLSKIGLSGRAFIPLMMGLGCTVPAAIGSRAIASKEERRRTLTLLPFIPCGARVPVFMLFARMFYPRFSALSLCLIYLGCALTAVLIGVFINKSVYKGKGSSFIMELPPYRVPSIKNVFKLMKNTLKSFLLRAFGVILIANTALWALSSLTLDLKYTLDANSSLLAHISGIIAPMFEPLGFGHWEAAAALISGLAAKENIVASIGLLYGSAESFSGMFTLSSALSFVAFSALYTPCLPALYTLSREMRSLKTFVFTLLLQFSSAYLIAFAVYFLV